MGTVYYLAGHPGKQLFELGKYWASVLLDGEIYRAGPWSLEDFGEYCLAYEPRPAPENMEWLSSVLPRLHAFCAENEWDVDLCDDCGGELFDLIDGGYRTVGSAYAQDLHEDDEEDCVHYLDICLERLRGSKLVTPEELEALGAMVAADKRLRAESTIIRMRLGRNG